MSCRALLVLVLLFLAQAGQAKSLYWKAVEVEARLDAEGLLHVEETQTFVFDGDWNGGERRFDIRAGQSLRLDGVDRVDAGVSVPLVGGGLDAVDRYDLLEGSTLRWRSRLPEDPPFENTTLAYRIRYTLGGILSGRENRYRLAHDFAFPDRQGMIERFRLHFEIDPVWQGIESPLVVEQDGLEPGRGVIVRGELSHLGAAVPSGVVVPPSPSPWLGYGLLAFLAAGITGLFLRFLAGERRLGRLGIPMAAGAIDAPWLEKNLFAFPPEVIGAAWDGKVGAPEIAAILADLVRQKKIETRVEPRRFRKPKLTMRLLSGRDGIGGYRFTVVNKLFFNRRTNTDTDVIREHYKAKGLDLAALVREPIQRQLERLPDWSAKTDPVNWRFDALALTGALVLMVAAGLWGGGNDVGFVALEAFGGLASLAVAVVAARYHSRAIDGLAWRFPLVLAFALPPVAATLYYLYEAPAFLFHAPALVAAVAWNLLAFKVVLDAMRSDETPEKIAARKKLLAARLHFKRELRSRTPRLDDDWFPYLLAFGLGSHVDGWFRAYGTATGEEGTVSSRASDASASGSVAGTSWSGGGGTFGGAGASGAWASAAAAVGAGVAAPGSSGGGSSGGGGGGGSSSGGGGGGGW